MSRSGFERLGLVPLTASAQGDDRYFQPFSMTGRMARRLPTKNVIGVLPGTNSALNGQVLVISAHYDHLGFGWPDGRAGAKGQLHPGADDNASGVAVMLELARLDGGCTARAQCHLCGVRCGGSRAPGRSTLCQDRASAGGCISVIRRYRNLNLDMVDASPTAR